MIGRASAWRSTAHRRAPGRPDDRGGRGKQQDGACDSPVVADRGLSDPEAGDRNGRLVRRGGGVCELLVGKA